MCDVPISPETFCKCLIALKLGRLKFNIKDDTLLDAVAYIDGLQKVRDSQNVKFFEDPTDWETYAKTKGKDEENE
jgi:hypothetical protein